MIEFNQWLAVYGVELTDLQQQQFQTYYELLVSWNERVNLTSIVEREQVYAKHFYDSLSLSFFTPLVDIQTLADIGSGAGFPAIPLKILYPHLQITIIDSLNKRIQFLNHLTDALQLTNVTCLHSRAEDAARLPELRDQFDLVTARAVAKLAVLSELCLPFVKPSGLFVAMKGSELDNEMNDSMYSVSQLKGKWVENRQFELPMDQAKRHFVIIKKTAVTPKQYPRKAGIPLKLPLMRQ